MGPYIDHMVLHWHTLTHGQCCCCLPVPWNGLTVVPCGSLVQSGGGRTKRLPLGFPVLLVSRKVNLNVYDMVISLL